MTPFLLEFNRHQGVPAGQGIVTQDGFLFMTFLSFDSGLDWRNIRM